MLNRVAFDNYNRVKAKTEEARISPGAAEEARVEELRGKLVQAIGGIEVEKHNFVKWLIWLDLHMAEKHLF